MSVAITEEILSAIKNECIQNITLDQASAKRFFKTSPNSYSAHDKFLGITVPTLRKIATRYKDVAHNVIETLLSSPYNEERLLALLLLVGQYQKADTAGQEKLCQMYLHNLKYVNNWNLVDSSAHLILGHYLYDKDRSLLNTLAVSPILWERRIAIVAPWYFLRQNDTTSTFSIALILLQDKHDLIHKAVGWMLREAGKRDADALLQFLLHHAHSMPRTMFRYAIEKYTKEQKIYLQQNQRKI